MVCPEHIDPPELPAPVEVVSAEGKTVIPGYVDQHVHVIGGGGEAGPYSRTPEVMLSDVTTAGVTTVIGVLGTDGTGRHPESLLAKVRGLETEGISAYMLTASYEIPLRTMTGDAGRDIILIDKVLGIGKNGIQMLFFRVCRLKKPFRSAGPIRLEPMVCTRKKAVSAREATRISCFWMRSFWLIPCLRGAEKW